MRTAVKTVNVARLSVAAIIVASAMFVLIAPGQATAIPARPTDGPAISPGHIPTVCPPGNYNSYGVSNGYYYSKVAKNWVQAPFCHPKWGNLGGLRSGATKLKGKFTVTAVPDGGSNSGTYAPMTKTIRWTYPGKRVSGCGSADMSCTVIPFSKGSKEWQWGEFNVSMPRHFFIDSPGSNCAGQHICAAFSTQAWGYVGVPPSGTAFISGKIVKPEGCSAFICPINKLGLGGVKVTIKSKTKTYTTKTDGNGQYKIEVDPGTYTVTPSRKKTLFGPGSRKAKAKPVANNVDFEGCGPSTDTRSMKNRKLDDGNYMVPGYEKNVKIPDDEYPNCALHSASANVKGNIISITVNAQLACPNADVQAKNPQKPPTFNKDFEFVSLGLKPGEKRTLSSIPAGAKLTISIPDSGKNNYIRLMTLDTEYTVSKTFGKCFAKWNRALTDTGDDTLVPKLTLGGVSKDSLPEYTL